MDILIGIVANNGEDSYIRVITIVNKPSKAAYKLPVNLYRYS